MSETTGSQIVSRPEAQSPAAIAASLSQRSFSSLFFDGRNVAGMIALCAEPGLCQEEVVTALLSDCLCRGYKVFRYDLRLKECTSASDLMVRVARRTSRLGSCVAVAFEHIPPSDESQVRRQVRALRKMWEAGVSVILSLPPEGIQLLEPLPECAVIRSHDLLLESVMGLGRSSPLHRLGELSWGIPSLVRALSPSMDSFGEIPLVPSSYYEQLGNLVETSLRLSLPDEELRLRLTLYLLGSGSKEDLIAALGCDPGELLDMVRDNVPLVSFSTDFSRFRCLTDVCSDALDACLASLSASCAMLDSVCPACIGVLLDRGAMARAASLFALPHSDLAHGFALLHATELIDIGNTEVLGAALENIPFADALAPDYRSVLRSAVLELGGRAAEAGSNLCLGGESSDRTGRCRDLQLFLEAKRVLGAKGSLTRFEESGWTALGRRLLAHREVCDLMVEGRFSAATRLLVANPVNAVEARVSSALLCLDFELARLLLGDAPAAEREEVEAASKLLSSEGVAGLSGYVDCLGLVRAVLVGAAEVGVLAGRLISQAERRGDSLVQLIALLAGCVTDLRTGAVARAGVRATLALAVAKRFSLDYLARIATLLSRVARFLLGETLTMREGGARCDDLEEVLLLVDEVTLPEEDAMVMGARPAERPPREALWVLLVLTEGMGTLSMRLEEAAPLEWKRAVSAMRMRLTTGGEGELHLCGGFAEGRLSLGRLGGGRGAPPIELQLLGGFELLVGGVPVLDGRLEHRNAKPMLEYIALQRGATAKRYQIVEQVWPECDYTTGFNRIYQATSVLRAAIGEMRPGLDPFVIGRSTKAITLNRGLMGCDVDEFRLCAREAADGTGDERVLEMARRAERLYAGDLYMPSVDATGFVAAARDELRLLYTDAMVAGAEAALRLGKGRTSVRLASNALSIDDMREDAVLALVRALKASGRNSEAEQRYRRYAGKLIRASGMPPSKQLRRAVGDASGGSRRAVISDAVMA